MLRRARVGYLLARLFRTTPRAMINPLLPFDSILEELNADEQKEANKALKGKNKKIEVEMQAKLELIGLSILRLLKEGSGDKGDNGGAGGKGDNGDKPPPPPRWWTELKERAGKFGTFLFKCLETMGITFSSIAILGLAGLTYHRMYYQHVIDKIDSAFDALDPALQLTMHKRTAVDHDKWVHRPQQDLLDDIVSGKIAGRYFLIIGEKGTGKTLLILELMRKVGGANCTFVDAHLDPEVFRIRLGRLLRFEYSEDYIGSLFSIRGPREATALLDIERAFNKLEEVAVTRVKRTKKPLVLVVNNAHLIGNDEEGRKIVELLQQKAELLLGSGLVTMIFNLDDYWLYERLKQLGTRMDVVNVRDFGRDNALKALRTTRSRYYGAETWDEQVANQVYDMIGGRPQHLAQVARRRDMLHACNEIIDREKTWILNQCGLLGEAMDDDVMESGKFLSLAMLLLKALVDMDDHGLTMGPPSPDVPPQVAGSTEETSENAPALYDDWDLYDYDWRDYDDAHAKAKLALDHRLPELPLWRARQIMTRSDYIQRYDNLNIFTIDSHLRVRADSVPMMRAFHEIAAQPGFERLLEETCDRVAAIELLGRTRELVAKDLVLGGAYKVKPRAKGGVEVLMDLYDDDEDPEDIYMEEIGKSRLWWDRRLKGLNTGEYVLGEKVETPASLEKGAA